MRLMRMSAKDPIADVGGSGLRVCQLLNVEMSPHELFRSADTATYGKVEVLHNQLGACSFCFGGIRSVRI